MKLIDYINSHNYYGDDYITIIKMENLMKKISSIHDNFTYQPLDLNIDISKINKKYDVLFSINGDLDFPRPTKRTIIEYNNSNLNEYNETIQQHINNIPYIDKLEISQLNQIPEHIRKIYCHSVGIHHEKVNMIPIGRDFKNVDFFPIVDNLNKNQKQILCYNNLTLPPKCFHWYGTVRRNIFEIACSKPFVYCKKCDVHPRHYSQNDIIQYYIDISKSKFMLCPRGCGIDTYRLWDSIHMGCIPIVEKYDGYEEFTDLPILYLNSWKEFEYMNAEFLENKWNEMIHCDYNYDKLRLSYWEREFLSNV